ncbi:hypothetical protein [Micromonospora sp. CPCC 205556]|uniref:hypothetical protein n=1 Tax=Micromonospora sp. CPCC 205556 TaxID=3122398 RepID=UPI002FEF5BA5
MLPIVLDGYFRPFAYHVGHSRLVIRSWAGRDDEEDVAVYFRGVLAVQLRSSYRPLVLDHAGPAQRAAMISFAQVPARHQDRLLHLAVSSGSTPGYVLCSSASVVAIDRRITAGRFPLEPPDGSRRLHQLRPATTTPVGPERNE